MPTTIIIDSVTLTLKKYPEFLAGTPISTDIILYADPVTGDLKKTTFADFGATPTLEQVLTAGSTLSSDHTILINSGQNLNIFQSLPGPTSHEIAFDSDKLSIYSDDLLKLFSTDTIEITPTVSLKVIGLGTSTYANVLYYDSASGEVKYGATPTGTPDRFGYPTEDVTTDANRSFNMSGFEFAIVDTDFQFVLSNTGKNIHMQVGNHVVSGVTYSYDFSFPTGGLPYWQILATNDTSGETSLVQSAPFAGNPTINFLMADSTGNHSIQVFSASGIYFSSVGYANTKVYAQNLPAMSVETDILFYDPGTGQVKYGAASGVGTDTNIYNVDGTLTGDRIVDLGGHSLHFNQGTGAFTGFYVQNTVTSGTRVLQIDPFLAELKSDDGSNLGQITTSTGYINLTSVQLNSSPLSSALNIYPNEVNLYADYYDATDHYKHELIVKYDTGFEFRSYKNTTGTPLDLLIYAKQLPSSTTANVLFYDTSTGQITYGAAPGGGGATADNGLTASGSNVQLGDTSAPGAALLHSSYIDAGTSYTLYITGTRAGNFDGILNVNNTGSTNAIKAIAGTGGTAVIGYNNGDGMGVSGTSTGGWGGWFSSDSSYGARAESSTGVPLNLFHTDDSPSGIFEMLEIERRYFSGSPSNGIGSSIVFRTQTSSAFKRESNTISSDWQVVTDASRISRFVISGANITTTVGLFKATGEAVVTIGDVNTTLNSTYIQINDLDKTVYLNPEAIQFSRPVSATTAATYGFNGYIVYVNTTDATFTSVGFWAFENGAWHKL